MEQVVFFVLVTFGVVTMLAVVAGWVMPLLQSARDVDPSWQLVEISGVVNFREALYPVLVRGAVTSNCTGEAIPVALWFFFPHPPGAFQSASIEGALLKGVFEYTYGYAVGSQISVNKLYALNVATATFTNFTNVHPDQPIYGSPARVVYTEAQRKVIVPQCEGCLRCTLKLEVGNNTVATITANFIEIYIRKAELK